MGEIIPWILAIISAVLLIGIVGGLIAFVLQLFRESRPDNRHARKRKKKKT